MVKEVMFGVGEENPYGEFFVGKSYLNILTTEGVMVANVTFEPGCRNNWHIHHAEKGGGQILLATDGEGWYQEEGCEAVSLKPGSVIEIKPGVKHWHGAKADSWFSHIALEIPGENPSSEWLEPVSDEHYSKL
jgi:quercetin dioxygenase-like cupin family protein